MDNILELLKNLSDKNKQAENSIPKEISDQYPYGEFPIRYTRKGQEEIRKSSEHRYSNNDSVSIQSNNQSHDNQSLSLLIPLLQIMSGQKKQPKDMLQLFSKLLFKDNPEMSKLFQLIPQIKSQETSHTSDTFETNKVNINSLKRID